MELPLTNVHFVLIGQLDVDNSQFIGMNTLFNKLETTFVFEQS